MTETILTLSNLETARKCEISTKNMILRSTQLTTSCGTFSVILGALENWQKPEWHMFAPVEYLAFLDKHRVRICVREYSVDNFDFMRGRK